MNLTVTKELLGKCYIENYGDLSLARMYKIFDQNDLVGQFFYHNDVSFFAYNNEDIKILNIENRKDWRPLYKIIDQKANLEIGAYHSSEVIGASFPLDSLILGTDRYLFEYVKSDSIFFDKYVFQLKTQNDIIDYHFEIDYSKSGYSDINLISLNGFVESTSENLFPIFAGVFMVEDFLNVRDRRTAYY